MWPCQHYDHVGLLWFAAFASLAQSLVLSLSANIVSGLVALTLALVASLPMLASPIRGRRVLLERRARQAGQAVEPAARAAHQDVHWPRPRGRCDRRVRSALPPTPSLLLFPIGLTGPGRGARE